MTIVYMYPYTGEGTGVPIPTTKNPPLFPWLGTYRRLKLGTILKEGDMMNAKSNSTDWANNPPWIGMDGWLSATCLREKLDKYHDEVLWYVRPLPVKRPKVQPKLLYGGQWRRVNVGETLIDNDYLTAAENISLREHLFTWSPDTGYGGWVSAKELLRAGQNVTPALASNFWIVRHV